MIYFIGSSTISYHGLESHRVKIPKSTDYYYQIVNSNAIGRERGAESIVLPSIDVHKYHKVLVEIGSNIPVGKVNYYSALNVPPSLSPLSYR
jgi:hypothetical protein